MKYLVLLTVVLIGFESISASGCSFKFATDFPAKESVLFWPITNDYTLVEPSEDGIYLQRNQKIIVSCPGARNSFTNFDKNLLEAQCVKDQKLATEGSNYLLSDLGCSTSVTGEFYTNGTACTSGGSLKYLGYYIQDGFKYIISVCYDDTIGGTLVASHVLYGSAIRYSGNSPTRPSFKVGGVAPGVSPESSYRQITQKSTFATLLGSAALASKYIYTNSYLAKGHLSPDADMVYASWKLTTYFYINTVPQWQQINNGNWKSLETSLRSVSANLGENFSIYTGSHDILALENVSGELVDIYLSSNKLPVPKFVWKVFYSPQTSKGIAFVSVNNPFVETITKEHYLCTDICDRYGWGTSAWKNPEKGLQYCCEIYDLKNVVNSVPDLDVSGVQEAVI